MPVKVVSRTEEITGLSIRRFFDLKSPADMPKSGRLHKVDEYKRFTAHAITFSIFLAVEQQFKQADE